MKTCYLSLLMFFCLIFVLLHSSEAHRESQLRRFFKSRWPSPLNTSSKSVDLLSMLSSPVYVSSQYGMMEADKIRELPGQPSSVDFNQYSGHVTVDSHNGKALFYYFVESPHISSEKPLILWLTGGPACSSLMGAMADLGPFRVNSDGETLYRNDYAWNNVANVIFLDTPAGVGFSYSNTTADHDIYDDDRITAESYIFLLNWFERFPQYKGRDFYIIGEGYAGHHVPQLASTIYRNNNVTNHNTINLQGIAVGNGYFDSHINSLSDYDFLWSHALISDQTYELHTRALKCLYNDTVREECPKGLKSIFVEIGDINFSNIYAPICHNSSKANSSGDAMTNHDPCSYEYVYSYLDNPAVQKALHAHLISQPWKFCSNPILETYKYGPTTMLPTINFLLENGVPIWFYSGDVDAYFPTISKRYFIKSLGLNVTQPWRPWYVNKEVGGYVEEYNKGITFVTIRGAGHYVQTDQPERALTMISSFLEGKLPPPWNFRGEIHMLS